MSEHKGAWLAPRRSTAWSSGAFLVGWWALGAAAGIGAAGCAKAPAEVGALPPAAVTVSYPLEQKVTDYNNFTGRTAAIETIQVRALVTGYLDKVRFKDGDL